VCVCVCVCVRACVCARVRACACVHVCICAPDHARPRPHLLDPTVSNNHHSVRVLHRAEPVGDEDDGAGHTAPPHDTVQGLLDNRLHVCMNTGMCTGILNNSSGAHKHLCQATSAAGAGAWTTAQVEGRQLSRTVSVGGLRWQRRARVRMCLHVQQPRTCKKADANCQTRLSTFAISAAMPASTAQHHMAAWGQHACFLQGEEHAAACELACWPDMLGHTRSKPKVRFQIKIKQAIHKEAGALGCAPPHHCSLLSVPCQGLDGWSDEGGAVLTSESASKALVASSKRRTCSCANRCCQPFHDVIKVTHLFELQTPLNAQGTTILWQIAKAAEVH